MRMAANDRQRLSIQTYISSPARLRISVIVTGRFGYHDRLAALLDTGGLVVL